MVLWVSFVITLKLQLHLFNQSWSWEGLKVQDEISGKAILIGRLLSAMFRGWPATWWWWQELILDESPILVRPNDNDLGLNIAPVVKVPAHQLSVLAIASWDHCILRVIDVIQLHWVEDILHVFGIIEYAPPFCGGQILELIEEGGRRHQNLELHLLWRVEYRGGFCTLFQERSLRLIRSFGEEYLLRLIGGHRYLLIKAALGY